MNKYYFLVAARDLNNLWCHALIENQSNFLTAKDHERRVAAAKDVEDEAREALDKREWQEIRILPIEKFPIVIETSFPHPLVDEIKAALTDIYEGRPACNSEAFNEGYAQAAQQAKETVDKLVTKFHKDF